MNYTVNGDSEAHLQYRLECLLTRRSYIMETEDIIIPKDLYTLRSLDLSYSSLKAVDALDYLTSLKQLETLHFGGSSISEKNLSGVSKLTTLTDLDLNATFINDKCINYLVPLTNLTRLSLAYTRISGITLSGLTILQNLITLELPLTCAKYETTFRNTMKKIITLKVCQTEFPLR